MFNAVTISGERLYPEDKVSSHLVRREFSNMQRLDNLNDMYMAEYSCSWEQRLDAAAAKKDDRSSRRWHKTLQGVSRGLSSLLYLVFTVCVPVVVPIVTSLSAQPEPLPLAVLTFCSMIVWMKLISYAMVNADYRYALRPDWPCSCQRRTRRVLVTCFHAHAQG